MKRVENLNAPSLSGWLIAAGAGIIAFVVAKVVGEFDFTTSGFFAVVVTVASGLVMGMPWGAADRIPTPEAASHDVPGATPVAAAAAVEMPAQPAVTAAAYVQVAAQPAVRSAAPASEPVPAEPAPKPKAAAKPKAATAEPAATAAGGAKPKALKSARKGAADDLKVIEGIGPALEKALNENGIFHIDQIAEWGAAEVEWMDGNLKGFKGRVTRDKWVAQAKLIGEVGTEEFLRRAKTNDY